MRPIASLAAFYLLGTASGQVNRRVDTKASESSRYIIEYAERGSNFRGTPRLDPENIQIVKVFDSDVFSGAAVETADLSADELLALPEVARVWRNRMVYLDPLNVTTTFRDDASSANYSSHHLTRVSGLHESGIMGQGAKVAVIDTGIQYTHPALGGGFGDGFKVAGGYDFVGDGNWPESGDVSPDDDPMDYQGHGTHVAGIVAGYSERFSGVAPKSTLYAYKVFSNSGGTTEAVLIEAFLRAYDDGVDIITASIGGTSGWEDNAWAVVASRLVDRGVVVTISAGNDGEVGPFYASSGSSGKNVLAVASTGNELSPAPSFRVNFDHHCHRNTSTVGYIPSVIYFSTDIVGWPIVPVSLDTNATDDACDPFPDGQRNFTGTIPLVRRGGCSVRVQQANLAAAGAVWILVYNNGLPLVQFDPVQFDSFTALIEDYSGEAIVEAVAAGVKVTADFSRTTDDIVGLPWAFGGRASWYSTWGGLNELQFKPDIAAPGGEIFSTYPPDRWSTNSGTSMAAPYVAGVAALYIGLNGGRDVHGPGFARKLARRIIASGNSVKWWDPEVDGVDAPPPQVGTGLIDAYKVINYTTSLDFEPIALNDTANFVPSHTITLHNGGDEEVRYDFSVEPARGIDILYPADGSFNSPRIRTLYDLDPVDMPVQVDLPGSITLQPGGSQLVTLDFQKPAFEGFAIPMYSGKILIKTSKNETLAVPYMGIGSDLKEEMENMYMDGSPDARHSFNWTSIHDNASWTNEVWGTEEDWLSTTVQLKWATRQLRWDIYESGWNESSWSYPPTVGENGHVGSVAYWTHSASRSWSQFSFDADPTDSLPFPLYDLNRNGVHGQYRYTFQWFGMLANGSQIEPGNYTMRFAALKPLGVPNESADWSVWKAPQISILGKFGPSPYQE